MDKASKQEAAVAKAINEVDFLRWCGKLLLGFPADKAINRILACLGKAHQADRAWLIRYNHDFTHFWNTHEWTRVGMSQHVLDLQGVPVEMGAWLHESLLKNRHVYIEDSKQMPRRAKVLQSEFLRQGIHALLSVPVFYRGRLMFQIGFDVAIAGVHWQEKEVRLLREVGRLIALRLLANTTAPAFQPDDEAQEAATIQLQDSTVHRRGFLDQITHISADGDYSHIHLLNARKTSDSHSLRHWESALTPRRFIRISRSVIVNLNGVESLDRRGGNWKLQLRDVAEPLSVGRNYRTNLRHRLES